MFTRLALKFKLGMPSEDEPQRDITNLSLSFLSKYWQDTNGIFIFSNPAETCRKAARLLIEEGLKMTGREKIGEVIDYWSKLLPNCAAPEHQPSQKKEEHRKMHRAVIILAIIICLGLADVSDSSIVSHVSQELFGLLYAEEGRDMFRMAAMELLGTGIAYWKDHIHVGSLFRLILSWGYSLSPIRNLPKNSGHSDFSYGIVVKTFGRILLWDVQNDRAKVFEEFCKELTTSPSTLDKIISMELLHANISDNAELSGALRPHICLIVNSLVALLDPSKSEERERLRPTLTPLLHAIVTNFEDLVIFEQVTQHIAAASQSNVVVYDMKSATKIASYSTETERIVKIALCKNNLGALVRKNDTENPMYILVNWVISGSGGGFLFFKPKPQIVVSQPFSAIGNLDSTRLIFKDQLVLVDNNEGRAIHSLAIK
jgi:hypothetical protein